MGAKETHQIGAAAAIAARTALVTGDTIVNQIDATGLAVIFNCTVDPSTASVTPTIQGYDETADVWYDILTGAAVAAVGVTALYVGLGVATVANVAAGVPVPRKFRVNVAVAGAESLTYGIDYELTR